MKRLLVLPLSALMMLSSACSDDADETVQPTCESEASAALTECVTAYGERIAECYNDGGASCGEDDDVLAGALSQLQSRVALCEDGDFGAINSDAIAGRLTHACESEASSAAWRSYGGPQGAAYKDAEADKQDCMSAIHDVAIDLIDQSLAAIADCVATDCSVTSLNEERAALEALSETAIGEACERLDRVVALTPEQFVANTADNVDCIAAAGLPDAAGLGLRCGPANSEITPTRGEWSEFVVDGEKWGTQCGDGSDYAFWIRPAPPGQPLDRVLVTLQGGGVCLFEEDCVSRFAEFPELFNARDADDKPANSGVLSTNAEISDFSDWTIVFLPYCTQDVFAGGGVDEVFDGGLSIPRYGAINLRSTVRIVRDYIWSELDAAGGEGFRPDHVTALFGGFSAGGYGTLYNYHWFLDDLLWPHTTAFPDAGLAIDNGETLGVANLGNVKIPAWNLRGFLPPYCFAGTCSGGKNLLSALSPRLLTVPNQQVLMLSNQRDAVQATTAFFADDAAFVNALRQTYCETRELPGINWYLTSVSDMSVHVVTDVTQLWQGSVDGVTMNDFFVQAIESPETLESHVEEGDFAADVPGVTAFPCSLDE